MREKSFAIAFAAILLICSFSLAAAEEQEFFYLGDISIDAIVANVFIDEKAEVILEYTLKNYSAAQESVELGFLETAELKINDLEVSNPVVFDANEEKILTVSYEAELSGVETRTFSFNLSGLTFDGLPNANRTKEFFAKVVLPEGVKKIIWSNKEHYGSGVAGDGRAYYTWQEADSYPTTLSVKFSTLDIDLSVVKKVSPERITEENQVIDFEITVTNNGDRELLNIVLMDDYETGEFEVVSPEEDFGVPDMNESDPRLIWSIEISSLGVGEEKVLTYSLKYIGDVSQVYNMVLDSCIVTVDNHLVAVSNEPVLAKAVGLKDTSEEPPPEPQTGNGGENGGAPPAKPIGLDFVGVLIVVIVVAAAAIFFFMKKK